MPSTATSILDGLSTSVAVKAPCRTVALTNITLSGLQTISGYTTVENDRVLVTGQTSAIDNGIYMASTGTWTRSKDADGARDLVQGTLVLVRSASADGAIWELTTANPIVIGTTALTFDLHNDPAIIYDQTAAEIAAGVTPTFYGYEPGDARRFGAVGDNLTNNTTALVNWAKSATPGLRMTLQPAGIYLFDPSAVTNGVLFTGVAGFSIHGNGATIKCVSGASVVAQHQMMVFVNCQDVYVENLIVDANRAARTPVESTTHNIHIRDNCRRIVFKKVRAINGVTDGWMVSTDDEATQSTYPEDITLDDCIGYNCYRNNLSVVASLRFTVKGGRYHGATGTSPQAGIDFEPDATVVYGNRDIVVENVDVSDNLGFGLSLAGPGGSAMNTRVTLTNIRGQLNTIGFIEVANVNGLDVDGAHCGPHTACTRSMIDLANGSVTDVSLRNLSFRNVTVSSSVKFLMYIHSGVDSRVHVDGMKVYGCPNILVANPNVATTLSNLELDGVPDAAITIGAANCVIRGMVAKTATGRVIYAPAADCVFENLTFIDCLVASSSALNLVLGATGCVFRNIHFIQTASIPASAVGIDFDEVPKQISGLTGKSAGTDFTVANICSFGVGVAGAEIVGMSPNPVYQTGATSVADGGTITHGLYAAPTSVRVTPSVSGELASVTALAATTFTVAIKTHAGAAGTTQTVYWEAKV